MATAKNKGFVVVERWRRRSHGCQRVSQDTLHHLGSLDRKVAMAEVFFFLRPRMQVIFLMSRERNSLGTGVFLPRGRGVSVDISSEIPAVYSPILIPYELVQSLNLNVYALEMQLASFIGVEFLMDMYHPPMDVQMIEVAENGGCGGNKNFWIVDKE
ncbi:hypothetical protein QJS10_CPA05g00866 [Acorus calamus]|uniref:Uncharacterized protein n=1 Tax=Acorus calamus TaxID=4465 RepID=A0AAV9EQD1_ACOCL|nr:hypothetical protein QJS10_CPA05g00866 [Acorus calamus]